MFYLYACDSLGFPEVATDGVLFLMGFSKMPKSAPFCFPFYNYNYGTAIFGIFYYEIFEVLIKGLEP